MGAFLGSVFAVAVLSGCSSEKASELQPVTVSSSASKGVKEVVDAAWPKAVKACPGLVKYAADLTFAGVEDNFSFAPVHAQRIEVMYLVAKDPKLVPADYRSSGDTCYFSLSPDGSKLAISKSACAKLCLDSPSGTSETSIPL